jgi:hypothetical protein
MHANQFLSIQFNHNNFHLGGIALLLDGTPVKVLLTCNEGDAHHTLEISTMTIVDKRNATQP